MTKFISWGFQWQPQMRSLLLHSLLSLQKVNFSFSVLLNKCLMPPGPAYNCMSVWKMPKSTPTPISGNLMSPPPSIHLYSAHLYCKSFPLFPPPPRYLSDTYLSFDPILFPSLSVSLSEASLGLWDIDFDAVRALCGGVLAKRGSLFSSQ